MSSLPLKSIFDSLDAAILLTDPNGTVLYSNAALAKETGFSVAETIGKKSGSLWGGHMDKSFYAHFWHTIRDEKQPLITNITNKNKQHIFYTDTVAVTPIINTKQDIVFYLQLIPPKEKQSPAFYHDFLKLFHDQEKHQHDILPWIAHTTKAKESDIITTIETNIIVPTKEQFKERYNDHELVTLAKNRPEFFSALYAKYFKDIRIYISCHLSQSPEIDDLTQETFIRAFRSLPHFTLANASYLTYLRRIAHNLIVNQYRNNEQKKEISYDDISEDDTISDASLIDILFNKEECRIALSLVSKLERDILILKWIEGQSIRDISLALGKTENAIKLIISRAKKKIRKLLHEAK